MADLWCAHHGAAGAGRCRCPTPRRGWGV